MKNPFQKSKRQISALENRMTDMEAALEAYFNSPVYIDSDDVGFNGQKIRKGIFNELCNIFAFESIIETGTYTGNTTGYMANKTALPLYSCELNRIYYALAKRRLSGINNINCYSMDSRYFLNSLAEKPERNKRVFVYLDAHWHDDLPLRQEIEIICRTWKEFVIMIDDFQVPMDTGYKYDIYKDKQSLTLNNYQSFFLQSELALFFPALPSSEETGARRGCVILTRKGLLEEKMVKEATMLKNMPQFTHA